MEYGNVTMLGAKYRLFKAKIWVNTEKFHKIVDNLYGRYIIFIAKMKNAPCVFH